MTFVHFVLFLVCSRIVLNYVVFFFKQKTAYEMRISDWSSDVCSSDLESSFLVLPLGEAPERVFDDDDCAIDNQAEIECAETHQIARDTELIHARRSHQHGDRNHRRRDEREIGRAHV